MKPEAYKEILDLYGEDIAQFKAGGGLTENLYDTLFAHYCFTGEMPYGVAKARTGDPYEWIDECFGSFIASVSVEQDKQCN